MKLQITILLLLLSVSFPSLHAQKITDGLVGFWPFTGNAVDSVKGLNNGTVYGATLTKDRFGNSNSAYAFDGNGDYIDVGSHSSLHPTSITMNFWFRYLDTTKTMSMLVNSNSLNGEWGTGINLQAIQGLQTGVGAGSQDHSIGHMSYERWADNRWHMVTVIFDKQTQVLAVYVDRCLSGYNNWKHPVYGGFTSTDSLKYYPNEHWIMGASSQYFSSGTVSPNWYKGDLDDVRIYNRPLSMLDIHALFYDKTSINDTTHITIYDTTFVSVTDTLYVNVKWSSTGPNFNRAKIYPNPTNEKVTIDFGDYLKIIGHKVVINDNTGKEVFKKDVTSRIMEIDLNALGAAGAFVMVITDKNFNVVAIKQLILQ